VSNRGVMTAGSTLGGWFAQLPATERAALYSRGTARRYRAGATLFQEGDLSDWVVLVTAGRVKVSVTTADGKEVVLGVCSAGDLLGELSAIDARPRSATATSIEPVDACVVPGEEFRAFLAGSPQASLMLLRAVSNRLRDSDRRQVEFIGFDSIGRAATRIAELAERFGVALPDGSIHIDIPLTQEELAGLTGTSREAIGKALQLFRRRGWITTGRRSITVVDVEGLRSRAT
jgi:CRP/FNR family transcriptional regulator, cyclic AMP receptor protein